MRGIYCDSVVSLLDCDGNVIMKIAGGDTMPDLPFSTQHVCFIELQMCTGEQFTFIPQWATDPEMRELENDKALVSAVRRARGVTC